MKTTIQSWRYMDESQRRTAIKNGVALLGMVIGLFALGSIIPLGFWGFDWYNFFGRGVVPGYFVPWTLAVLKLLTFPSLFTLSGMALVLRAWRYKASPLTLAMVLVSLPTMWSVLFSGSLDALTLLGLLLMPLGVPLVLLKPQVASFALLARRRWIVAGIVWGLITLLLWGFWPQRFLMVTNDANWRADWPQEISLFPWGMLLALPLFWFSRGDEDLMMAAGSLMTPHLFPYHFIVLMPSIARMDWPWRLATWIVSWLPILANWLGPIGWHFGNVLSLCFWIGIYLSKKAKHTNVELAQGGPAPAIGAG